MLTDMSSHIDVPVSSRLAWRSHTASRIAGENRVEHSRTTWLRLASCSNTLEDAGVCRACSCEEGVNLTSLEVVMERASALLRQRVGTS